VAVQGRTVSERGDGGAAVDGGVLVDGWVMYMFPFLLCDAISFSPFVPVLVPNFYFFHFLNKICHVSAVYWGKGTCFSRLKGIEGLPGTYIVDHTHRMIKSQKDITKPRTTN